MRISDWSSDVCSSDLRSRRVPAVRLGRLARLGGCDAGAVAAVHLPGADACRGPVLRIDDGVRFHMLGDGPGEHAVVPLAGVGRALRHDLQHVARSEEHTSELQSLMRISYAVFCL